MLNKADIPGLMGDIDFLCRCSFDTFKIPFYFLNGDGDILFSYTYPTVQNPVSGDFKPVFRLLLDSRSEDGIPVIITTKCMENFFCIDVKSQETFWGAIMAGPSIESDISVSTTEALATGLKMSLKDKKELQAYYNCCPIKDYHTLVGIIAFIFYSLYGKKLDIGEIVSKNSSFKNENIINEKKVGASLSQNRQNSVFHHTPEFEKRLLECVKDGNTDRLLALRYSMDGTPGVLSKGNPIRNQKNYFICMVTLVTRAAIEGGLNSELAYTLSDLYIQEVEELGDIKDLENLNNKMLLDFSSRVKAIKSVKYSRTITRCQAYIFKHIYENIALSDLAEHVDLNANYLSEFFKNETGITITQYIQMEQVNEAKKLLESTNSSLLDISVQLNFCNQSHFTKIFKKVAGVTPKKYREKIT